MSLKSEYPLYLANRAETPNLDLEVVDKYSGEVATRVPLASPALIDEAIGAADQAAGPMAEMKPYERQAVLKHCVKRFTERVNELAESLCIEAGKPIKDSRGEVARLIDTFQIACDEAVKPHGEMLNLEIGERTKGYRGWTKRVPIGPCSFISPFNFPLNLAAHKIAPAIAAGCPFVLKPASKTPIGALLIGEILAECDLPEGAFSILPCSRDGADLFTTDERLKLLSFTGSPDVGWKLKEKAGKKKVILELGGNAACIIDDGADLDDAVSRVITGAFYQSGQSCISVQRILVHEAVAEAFESKLLKAARALKSGDPKNEDTFIGPMISEAEAERVMDWIQEAKDGGAEVLCGDTRKGNIVEATLMKNVPRDAKLYREEVFGPVALLETFGDFNQAIDQVNDSRYGIHAGVFTPRIDHAMRAWDRIEAGGVLINEIPSWRVDHMPYGGIKESGLGREGLKYAIEDMTEIRALVIRQT
ncbi:MAG: aldehyde dehydrogenase family protein [Verrucomicrobia bacterium]|nr:aldehyde dehydrogenase family protein [Verrucomicrobiota bacterium]MCH8510580.1 aldehyde dehydrogenase family protein [Kiritimatiellia bacterium]